MKYFFVEITQQDGEHEHNYKAVGEARSLDEMQKRMAIEQEYEMGSEPEQSIVAYGDDLTAAYTTVHEMDYADYVVLQKYVSHV